MLRTCDGYYRISRVCGDVLLSAGGLFGRIEYAHTRGCCNVWVRVLQVITLDEHCYLNGCVRKCTCVGKKACVCAGRSRNPRVHLIIRVKILCRRSGGGAF